MTTYSIECPTITTTNKNNGDLLEWALCRYYKVNRSTHDNLRYDICSDLDTPDGKHISIKASGFTLMSGTLCEGRTTFEGILNLYSEKVHSNTFAYITKDFVVYEMNLTEFRAFLCTFGRVERESSKNHGLMKIRCRKESKKMLRWLSERAAA